MLGLIKADISLLNAKHNSIETALEFIIIHCFIK